MIILDAGHRRSLRSRFLYRAETPSLSLVLVDVLPSPCHGSLIANPPPPGVCGTDGHIHDGEFIAKFPVSPYGAPPSLVLISLLICRCQLIPGHESIGDIVEMGKNVTGFEIGDRCVADVGITCDSCFHCRRGENLFCEDFKACGVNTDGGFAEYIK